MKDLIKKFKNHVIKKSANPSFIHHEWFVKYHLQLVEKIAMELCEIYKQADKKMVLLPVWLHDYGKILDFNNEHQATLAKGGEALRKIGFTENLIKKAISLVEIIDKKEEINNKDVPIEAKIISSADGASHLIGPFFSIYWKENSQKTVSNLMDENIRKSTVDWDKKIVLPEIKKAFESRHNFLLEQRGKFPKKFLESDF